MIQLEHESDEEIMGWLSQPIHFLLSKVFAFTLRATDLQFAAAPVYSGLLTKVKMHFQAIYRLKTNGTERQADHMTNSGKYLEL